LFHVLIVLAFGALGMYFGCFVAPQYFSHFFADWTEYLFQAAYFLYLELAVIGFTFFVISIYGAIEAYKSLANPHDDAPVVNSLSAFVAEGWILSIGLLLQGVLLFDVVSNDNSSNMAFTVVVSLVFAIILLIATNIPMVKLYDGRDQNQLLVHLLRGVGVFAVAMAVETGLSLILTLLETYSGKAAVSYFLGIMVISNAIVAVLSFLAAKKIKDGNAKIAGYLASGMTFAYAAGFIVYGALDMVYYESTVHFNHTGAGFNDQASNVSNFGYGFPIMCIVIGAVLLAASAYLIWYSAADHHKPAAPHKA